MKSSLFAILILWALTFLSHSGESGMKPDALVNSVAAKNVLKTGDWKVLHYTPSAYKDFYPHPPLAIWMQAVSFKLFGISDWAARFPAALMGLFTVLIVFFWGRRQGSEWEGFVAAIVLLTSLVYLKFGADGLLEGPMTGFLFAGAYCTILALSAKLPSRAGSLALLAGVFAGLTFVTKTAFVVYLPLAAALALFLCRKFTWSRIFSVAGLGTLGTALVVGAWFLFGDGWNFLQHHWNEIRPRATQRDLSLLHLTFTHLLSSYWPWLPFFGLGIAKIVRERTKKNFEATLALMVAASVFFFLTFATHFLEHYIVPFYPAAALVTARYLGPKLASRERKIRQGLWIALLVSATLLAVLPVRLRLARTEPFKTVLNEIDSVCTNISEVLISDKAGERWNALSAVLWESNHEATWVAEPPKVPGTLTQILLTHPSEAVSPTWTEIKLHNSTAVRAWTPSVGSIIYCR